MSTHVSQAPKQAALSRKTHLSFGQQLREAQIAQLEQANIPETCAKHNSSKATQAQLEIPETCAMEVSIQQPRQMNSAARSPRSC